MLSDSSINSMQGLFRQYAQAFVMADSQAINAHYAFPMAFYTEQGQMQVMSEQAFAQNTPKLLTKYQQLGFAAVDFDILEQQSLSDILILVSVLWQFNRVDGSEIYRATTRYMLNTGIDKIVAVVVVDEGKAWQKLEATFS